MADATYEVVFSGQIKTGMTASAVQDRLRSRLKLSRRDIRELFSGDELIVKRTAYKATAEQYSAVFDEAGAVCRIRRGSGATADSPSKSLIISGAHGLNDSAPGGSGATNADMGSTLMRYLHIPFQTETGRWLFLRLPKPDGASTRDLSVDAHDAMQRLKSRLLHPSARSFDISRVIAGALMAIPTGGLALGVGTAMLLDGAVAGGLFNLLFFGAISAYGVWLVVTGVRSSRRGHTGAITPRAAAPPADRRRAAHEPLLLEAEPATGNRPESSGVHPRILSFMEQTVRTAQPCSYDYQGAHLWGVTTSRSCQGLPFLLSLVAASLGVGLWIPAFVTVALVLVVLLLLAASLSRLSEKRPRQFHLDLATDPARWSSNDEKFWRPVRAFFERQKEPEQGGWLKRRRNDREKSGRRDRKRA